MPRPRLVNVAHSVSVHANVPKGGAEGVLLSMGGNDGGFAFYVQGGKLTYGYNYVADQRFKVQSDGAIPEGDHIFSFEFTPTGARRHRQRQGRAGEHQAVRRRRADRQRRFAGDRPACAGPVQRVSPSAPITGSPVDDRLYPPFPFTGTVKKALVDVSGEAVEDKEAKLRCISPAVGRP